MNEAHADSARSIDSAESSDSIKAIENDREFKAHIYQQLVDLQPFLAPDSQIAVLVQQDDDEGEKEFALTLVATLGEYRLEVEGRAVDLYDAFGAAKVKMLEQLDEYFNVAVDSEERDEQIQTLLHGGATVH